MRWYDREDHKLFDVCADDHCQRYHGITKIISPAASQAVRDTRGVFLVHGGEICDARYSKSCGGRSEVFATRVGRPFGSVSPDGVRRRGGASAHQLRRSRRAVGALVAGSLLQHDRREHPPAGPAVVRPGDDGFLSLDGDLHAGGTGRAAAEAVGHRLWRGPPARAAAARAVGAHRAAADRRVAADGRGRARNWRSGAGSARRICTAARLSFGPRGARGGVPARFTLHGAGWGHGVGFCQIGAAVMAAKGFQAEQIVKHYFRGAELKKLY